MRRAPSRGQLSVVWDALNWQRKARSSWTKLESSPQKLRLLFYGFFRNANLSASEDPDRYRPMFGLLPPPIATWRLPSPRVLLGATSITGSTSFPSRCPLCGNEEDIPLLVTYFVNR